MRHIRLRHLFPTALLGLLLCCPVSLPACLDIDFNEHLYHPNDRFLNQVSDPGVTYRAEVEGGGFEETFQNWKKRCERDGRRRDCTRHGVCLALKGDLDGALAQLMVVEADFPGMYATAVSIATVHALKRQYAEAVTWMEKALKIEPRGHNGAESIHLSILRIELAGEQSTCTSQELIGYDFGTDSIPRSRLAIEMLDTLQANLFLILDQREFFRAGKKDPIAARLAFELGNLNFLLGFPSASLQNYVLAGELGFKDPLLEMRKAAVVTSDYEPPVRARDKQLAEEVMRDLVRQNDPEMQELEAKQLKKYRSAVIFVSVLMFLGIAVVLGVVMYNYYNRRSRPAPVKRDRFDDLFRDDD